MAPSGSPTAIAIVTYRAFGILSPNSAIPVGSRANRRTRLKATRKVIAMTRGMAISTRGRTSAVMTNAGT